MFLKKKGIALVIVLMIIFISTALLMMVSTKSDIDADKQIFKGEKIRAEMLAKGAIQHAMLKIRYFPTEFYDAASLYYGEGKIADKEINFIDKSYLGEVFIDDSDNIRCSGEFIRDLGVLQGEEVEQGFNADDEEFAGQVKAKAPFGGSYYVKKIELLSHDNRTNQDTVRITVYAQEISGKTTAVIKNALRGTDKEKQLNEGLTYTVIKELKWR
ncbi:MAG: hypothetical protein C0601_09500 [Candidatus Muiribacterium halophilum]|uniref:Uncharacterized protein n=1 Tax=Muiribacterium halophilum TaxID=2053465 RepID=A0A2N5ZDF3_MUIH1|nr:MAG: hypothetical protein C0601_09500 [Candidatus Muirbacterium halophilum]